MKKIVCLLVSLCILMTVPIAFSEGVSTSEAVSHTAGMPEGDSGASKDNPFSSFGFSDFNSFPANSSFSFSGTPENKITTTGKATITMAPDTASISFGVSTYAKDASKARTENAELVDKFVNALKEHGIDEDDIVTSFYRVDTRRNYDNTSEGDYPIIGYDVSNNVTITVKDLDKVSEFIDIGMSNGATDCYGIEFYVSNTQNYYDLALKTAVEDARSKAELIAECSDMSTPVIVEVKEISSSQGIVFSSDSVTNDSIAVKGADISTPIYSGDQTCTAYVEVVFSASGV